MYRQPRNWQLSNIFHIVILDIHLNYFEIVIVLKVVLQILGREFYKNTKESSLYSERVLIFIHENPVVENRPATGEIRELLWPSSTPTGTTVYFYMSSSLIYILQIHRRKYQIIASDEDIMEIDYMFVILWNLSVISHLIF